MPSRSRRCLTKPHMPLRCRLGQTKRPDRKKMKCAIKIEAEPTLVVDDWKNPPIKGRAVKGRWRCWLRNDVGRDCVEGHDQQQQHAPQILERPVGLGHLRARQDAPQSILRFLQDNTTPAPNLCTTVT